MSIAEADPRARNLGVTIEARYTAGEYDILILSARESAGPETWLRERAAASEQPWWRWLWSDGGGRR